MASEQPKELPTASLVAAADHPGQDGFFKSAQWSADGTTVFTSSSTNTINSYILPEDLLSPREEPLPLHPQGTITLPEPTHAIAPSPYFSLQNPYTHLILAGAKDHPIQLHHAFPQHQQSPSSPSRPPPLASYPLIHASTETYQTPTSLLWPQPGTHFLAGTRNQIAYFDASRAGSGTEPLLRIPTIPSARHNLKGGGVGMRGTVSALSVQSGEVGVAGLIAAGTWTRWVGLYDLLRAGECVATWGVKGAAAGDGGEDMNPGSTTRGGGVGGAGILQTVWSPCGRYLVVNERKSSGLLVYDVRVMGRVLGWLAGREADTHQRLSCDVFPGVDGVRGFEVWAGTVDGAVKVWEGVGNQEGYVERSWDWKGHVSAVGSAAMHGCGSVVATCSGAWRLLDDEEYEDGSDEGGLLRPRTKIEESSLKIWSIKGPSTGDTDHSPED
ncbi:hypothetical protein CONLIGDRAFT_242167 [Coniochaeta ligniaria NRRL 30616]|uniref:WD40 repeat-like protein n=1 Tax=Coniochaeta ligniaria NRRL 30616 TaxID=1408157 RepID=A0A1J7IXC1_9PEZI|nr:hypothetical protein CONLIGDRAFT_242167 [Coniochaeta ligniaria NRRL 30616]